MKTFRIIIAVLWPCVALAIWPFTDTYYEIRLLIGSSTNRTRSEYSIGKPTLEGAFSVYKQYPSGREIRVKTSNVKEIVELEKEPSFLLKKTPVKNAHSSPRSAGERFLAENGQRIGVITTASGLQYEVIKAGDGPKPVATDKVTVHYHGTLIDGKVFDSSVERGMPITFGVQEVIKGWTEALQLMPVGSKWRVYIPSGLAYGEQGAGGDIGPNEALIFDIELLNITR